MITMAKKYRGKDPIKKYLNNPKNREKLYRIYYIISIWIWISVIIGALVFIIFAIKYLW